VRQWPRRGARVSCPCRLRSCRGAEGPRVGVCVWTRTLVGPCDRAVVCERQPSAVTGTDTGRLRMGAGASLPDGLPAQLDESAAREFARDKFDKDLFDKAAKNGIVSRDAFLSMASGASAPMSTASSGTAALTEAETRLAAALEAMRALTKDDFNLLKSYSLPPPLVQDVLACCAVLKGVQKPLEFASAMRMQGLEGPNFRTSLESISYEELSEEQIERLRILLAGRIDRWSTFARSGPMMPLSEEEMAEPGRDGCKVASRMLQWVLALVHCHEVMRMQQQGGSSAGASQRADGAPPIQMQLPASASAASLSERLAIDKATARSIPPASLEERSPAALAKALQQMALQTLSKSGLEVAVSGNARRLLYSNSGERVSPEEQLDDYAEVAAAAMDYAHSLMIEEVGVQWYSYSGGTAQELGSNEPEITRSRGSKFLATKDWQSNPNLLVLITGTGSVRAGVWGRQLCVVDSLEHGTGLEMMMWAVGTKGWAAVAMDPNDPAGVVDDADQDPDTRGLLHCVAVSKLLSARAQATSMFFVAHSFGGACFIDSLALAFGDRDLPRLRAVAFTDSVHYVEDECIQLDGGTKRLSKAQLAWVRASGRHWRQAKEPLDTVEDEFNSSSGCRTVSAGIMDHPSVNFAADPSIREFFEECAGPT